MGEKEESYLEVVKMHQHASNFKPIIHNTEIWTWCLERTFRNKKHAIKLNYNWTCKYHWKMPGINKNIKYKNQTIKIQNIMIFSQLFSYWSDNNIIKTNITICIIWCVQNDPIYANSQNINLLLIVWQCQPPDPK